MLAALQKCTSFYSRSMVLAGALYSSFFKSLFFIRVYFFLLMSFLCQCSSLLDTFHLLYIKSMWLLGLVFRNLVSVYKCWAFSTERKRSFVIVGVRSSLRRHPCFESLKSVFNSVSFKQTHEKQYRFEELNTFRLKLKFAFTGEKGRVRYVCA